MSKTDFDRYLDRQLKNPEFAERFRRAGEAWEVALRLVELREKSGYTQAQLAKLVGTTQQQISRLETPSYEGHSLAMLRRVADALGSEVSLVFKPKRRAKQNFRTAE